MTFGGEPFIFRQEVESLKYGIELYFQLKNISDRWPNSGDFICNSFNCFFQLRWRQKNFLIKSKHCIQISL